MSKTSSHLSPEQVRKTIRLVSAQVPQRPQSQAADKAKRIVHSALPKTESGRLQSANPGSIREGPTTILKQRPVSKYTSNKIEYEREIEEIFEESDDGGSISLTKTVRELLDLPLKR